ncbi:alpha/beta hydrolase [Rhizobium halophytocola]|uniref:Acetyl esterase/lipase n=1 Tax=Rhizobium halophytocola TaxID=735519 RepID=A0ABS4DZA4_9HYPH|nr:alpha/beta hydrolase [Rhizobium halophytocola]MBP1851022.1 acetyl esterase/lipase [Rhizobium halophytocola]
MLVRRQFLTACVAPLLFSTRVEAGEASSLSLWPAGPPEGGGPRGPIRRTARGAVSNVATPHLRVVRPAVSNGAAVLIAGGGGYRRIEEGAESDPAADWFAARGITAFVLTYRLPGEGWVSGAKAPLEDAVRAMRVIRAGAPAFRLDIGRVGVIGFSAGGHLAGMLATQAFEPVYGASDGIDLVSARPDFAVLAYPVVTLVPPYDHTVTRRSLVGAHPTSAQSREWSVETHVDKACPPFFLVQAVDDPIASPMNTVILKRALDAHDVPADLLQLGSGGHGFGMGRPGSATESWTQTLAGWLKARALIG